MSAMNPQDVVRDTLYLLAMTQAQSRVLASWRGKDLRPVGGGEVIEQFQGQLAPAPERAREILSGLLAHCRADAPPPPADRTQAGDVASLDDLAAVVVRYPHVTTDELLTVLEELAAVALAGWTLEIDVLPDGRWSRVIKPSGGPPRRSP
jgi:hypothetical protein